MTKKPETLAELDIAIIAAARALMEKSDDLQSAMEGVTDQFEPEVAGMSAAASVLCKLLEQYDEAHGVGAGIAKEYDDYFTRMEQANRVPLPMAEWMAAKDGE